MLREVMKYFGLDKSFEQAGYFEIAEQVALFKELKRVIRQGGLIALSGMVGCGKTTALQRLMKELSTDKDIVVSRSLAVEKERVSLGTLIVALFCDLSSEKNPKLPTMAEQRERKLLSLIQKCRKPIALFVDEAHDLDNKTLVKLKRLIELVRNNDGSLSVILAGHPKLTNDLRQPNLEEIGARAMVFTLEGIKGYQRDYIQWLLKDCAKDECLSEELLSEEALQVLAQKLMTPLQIKYYLRLAFEEAYRLGVKPVTQEIAELVIAASIDDLEPRLIRQGYNTKVLANLLNIKPNEVRSLLQGQLPSTRTQDLKEQMLRQGIPV